VEERIAIPPYMVHKSPVQPDLVDILHLELSQLQEENGKINHLPEGSKDVADSVACVVSAIMGDPRLRRRVPNADPGVTSGGRTGGGLSPTMNRPMLPTPPSAPVAPPSGRLFTGSPSPWRPR
jgi:hypothetical protein